MGEGGFVGAAGSDEKDLFNNLTVGDEEGERKRELKQLTRLLIL